MSSMLLVRCSARVVSRASLLRCQPSKLFAPMSMLHVHSGTAIKKLIPISCCHNTKRYIKVEDTSPPSAPPRPESKQEVNDRAWKAIKTFDRLPKDIEITLDSHFITDLGLDSLDHVEIIMMVEDEFGFEIPDGEADKLLTPKAIIQYICDRQDVFE